MQCVVLNDNLRLEGWRDGCGCNPRCHVWRKHLLDVQPHLVARVSRAACGVFAGRLRSPLRRHLVSRIFHRRLLPSCPGYVCVPQAGVHDYYPVSHIVSRIFPSCAGYVCVPRAGVHDYYPVLRIVHRRVLASCAGFPYVPWVGTYHQIHRQGASLPVSLTPKLTSNHCHQSCRACSLI